MAPSVSGSGLPSGCQVFTTMPDILFILEFIFGGLVWILVASTHVRPEIPQGWVMFVSVFCFVMTFIWLIIFACGGHKNKSGWVTADFAYHLTAAFFYFGASVPLASVTIAMKNTTIVPQVDQFRYYQIDIAAVVFSYITTLLYFVHCVLSAIRWKSF
ncbi:mal, T cell differentiation protein b isoform X5 [Electrophorus electricus]|uniref:mal, T cell differentiation protein b isoform X5 n=1 Tax=Electrophorus electricus TaxID=8005 RepID=UPI000F0A0B7B|nr:mal, T cell differentiation protein b isoform X5 [Electrophorus electricus]